MKLKFGELNARMLCQYTAFAQVVAGIFGDKQDGPTPAKGDYTDLAEAPSYDAALAAMNAALNVG
jgi:hypothetical protein